MNQNRSHMNQSDKIVFILMVFLLSCFLIFEKYSWGKYAFLVASGTIFLIDTLQQKKRFMLLIDRFHVFFASFVLFCALSSLWAINSSYALEWSRSLLNNLIFVILIFPYFSRKKDISMLLSIIMWSSYIIAFYTIWYYGLDRLFMSSYSQYIRLGNDYSNINTIGMFCAIGLLVLIERIMSERIINWYTIFSIPAIIVVAATQSRKAVIILVLGSLMMAVLKSTDKKNIIRTIKKYVFIAVAVGGLLFLTSKVSIFSGVTERLEQLFSVITGKGSLDSGTVNRKKMIELGFQTWLQHPIGGVGVNCPRLINESIYGENSYLHNNFIELLCGVGIVGFLLYYNMFYYIIRSHIRYKRNNQRYFVFGIVLSIALLIIDYGMVSYYSKIQCFYLMVLFLNVRSISENSDTEQVIE